VLGRQREDGPLERFHAVDMEEEEVLEVHGADAGGILVCDGPELERKQVGGGEGGKGVEIVRGGENVEFEGTEGSVRGEELEQGLRGKDSGLDVEAIDRHDG
jgi:hypothetical protein